MPAAVGAALLGEIGLESAALLEAFSGVSAATAAATVGYVTIGSPTLPLCMVLS